MNLIFPQQTLFVLLVVSIVVLGSRQDWAQIQTDLN